MRRWVRIFLETKDGMSTTESDFFSTAQAAMLGNTAEPPLGISSADLITKAEVSRGSQSVVYEGQYADQRVAIKKAKIGRSADLDNFKLEVLVMAKLRHVRSVVSLVAARLIPPGASLSVAGCYIIILICISCLHSCDSTLTS